LEAWIVPPSACFRLSLSLSDCKSVPRVFISARRNANWSTKVYRTSHYWERGRPRPHERPQHTEFQPSDNFERWVSRFALTAGEDARAPSNKSDHQSRDRLKAKRGERTKEKGGTSPAFKPFMAHLLASLLFQPLFDQQL
jgi:hypothetical protein